MQIDVALQGYQDIAASCLDADGRVTSDTPEKLNNIVKLAQKQSHNLHYLPAWISGLATEVDPSGERNIRYDLEIFIKSHPALAAQLEMYLHVQSARYEASIEHEKIKKSYPEFEEDFYDEVYAHTYGVLANALILYYSLPEKPSDKRLIDDSVLYRNDLGLTKGYEAASIFVGVILHDFGKLAFPDALNLVNIRNDHKHIFWNHIHSHPELGGLYITQLENNHIIPPEISGAVRAITTQHHESYGRQPDYPHTGYPKGLHGEEIHMAARAVTYADIFDAITRKRGYKEEVAVDRVFKIIHDLRDRKQIDPIIDVASVENMRAGINPPMNCDQKICPEPERQTIAI